VGLGYVTAAWLLAAPLVGCGESTAPEEAATGGASGEASGGSGATSGNAGAGGASATGGSSGSTATGGASGEASGGSGATSGNAGAGGASATGGASGAAGSAGTSSACPNIEVDDTPGIVVSIAGETIEFREDLLWYDGRPPTLDLSAHTDAAGWTSFRIFIDPEGPSVVVGELRDGPGSTYVLAQRGTEQYDSIDNNASTICVVAAGTGEQARVAGTFAATLVNADGDSFDATGTFSGTLGQ
jgi:hypothetical protein